MYKKLIIVMDDKGWYTVAKQVKDKLYSLTDFRSPSEKEAELHIIQMEQSNEFTR